MNVANRARMEQTVSSAWVKGVADMLATAGLNVAALFKDAHMDIAALNNPDARYPSSGLSALWTCAAIASNNPAIGLTASRGAVPSMFDVVAYAMMSSDSLLEGLQRLARFVHILTDAATVIVSKDHGGHWVNFNLNGDRQTVPRQRNEFNMITVLNFCRWLTKRDISPSAVEISYSLPADIKPYTDAFQCPIHFGTSENRMFFPASVLELSLPTSNPFLRSLHDQYANYRLDRLVHGKISLKTRDYIVSRLMDGEPLKSDIASAMCMSERTLQRRLQEEGTSFQQVVDNARRALAQEYLGRHHLSMTQAACLLCFADRSAFARACKRWFGKSPRRYRDDLLAESVTTDSFLSGYVTDQQQGSRIKNRPD